MFDTSQVRMSRIITNKFFPLSEKSEGCWRNLPKIQNLFLECARVSTCTHSLAPSDFLCLTDTLRHITLKDVGVSPPSEEANEIEYTQIAHNKDFTIAIFMIPRGLKLPLHDHPGMIVLTKVLFGALEMASFDAPIACDSDSEWVPPEEHTVLTRATSEENGTQKLTDKKHRFNDNFFEDLLMNNCEELKMLGSTNRFRKIDGTPASNNKNIYRKRKHFQTQIFNKSVMLKESFKGTFKSSDVIHNQEDDDPVIDADQHIAVTLPTSCNVHEFRAVSNTAIIDVILPSYDDCTRPCWFYYPVDTPFNAYMRAKVSPYGNYSTNTMQYQGPCVDPEYLMSLCTLHPPIYPNRFYNT